VISGVRILNAAPNDLEELPIPEKTDAAKGGRGRILGKSCCELLVAGDPCLAHSAQEDLERRDPICGSALRNLPGLLRELRTAPNQSVERSAPIVISIASLLERGRCRG
jgi:hypothetical protein